MDNTGQLIHNILVEDYQRRKMRESKEIPTYLDNIGIEVKTEEVEPLPKLGVRRHFEIVKDYQGVIDATHLPRRGTTMSAGYDFKSAVDIEIPSLLSEYIFYMLNDKQGDTYLPAKSLDEIETWLKRNKSMKPTLVPTGIKAIMPENEYLSLDSRSSIPLNSGLVVANSRGIIDADYQYAKNDGHIHVMVYNLSPFPIHIRKGDKIAQGIFHKYEITTDDDPIQRQRMGGFGSTGVK